MWYILHGIKCLVKLAIDHWTFEISVFGMIQHEQLHNCMTHCNKPFQVGLHYIPNVIVEDWMKLHTT